MIEDYSKKLNKSIYSIDKNAVEMMKNYTWPGNIRELQNIIEYSINMSLEEKITLNELPSKIKNNINSQKIKLEESEIIKLEDLEKNEIIKALKKYKDYKKDKDLVAKSLGISRATLYRKIEKYNI
jgi:transcriptional regulator with PAS, ATPase and Fis domain